MRAALFLLALSNALPAAAQVHGYPRDRGSGQPAVVQPIANVPLETLIKHEDYPAAAVRGSREGTVGVRLTVSAAGKVSDCTVRESSASPILDTTTCTLLRRRARFAPALDAVGRPTEGQYDHVVSWKITNEVRWEVDIQLPRKVDTRLKTQR